MTARIRQLAAGVLGTALLLLLLLLAALDAAFAPQPPELIPLTEVQMFTPPPPPPPPPVSQSQNSSSANPSLVLQSLQPQITLQIMELDVQLQPGEFGGSGRGVGGFGEGTGVDWGTVNLSELDGMPSVVSAPLLAYPEALSNRGIDEYTVRFHILIDEEGRTHPVRIVENPYPEMARELEAFAANVRFTPPTRLGVPVRVEYLWPVIFSKDSSL
jgi:Gram-negative bacterial TonB protein C-terminal